MTERACKPGVLVLSDAGHHLQQASSGVAGRELIQTAAAAFCAGQDKSCGGTTLNACIMNSSLGTEQGEGSTAGSGAGGAAAANCSAAAAAGAVACVGSCGDGDIGIRGLKQKQRMIACKSCCSASHPRCTRPQALHAKRACTNAQRRQKFLCQRGIPLRPLCAECDFSAHCLVYLLSL